MASMASFELICPAGTPAALSAAVEAGGDAIYVGFRDETNARNFPGLNFSRQEFRQAATFVHTHGRKLYAAINTYPTAGNPGPWQRAIDDAAQLGADAIILADIGLLNYANHRYPNLRRHLSVQASVSNPETLAFYQKEFGIQRAVLPRVLTISDIGRINNSLKIETEVFVFGGMCPMAEGRCSLSSYITGRSPNRHGVCSPASHVRYESKDGLLLSRLGEFTINIFDDHESAGYPTLCKGRFKTDQCQPSYLFEEPTSLNALALLPDLKAAGVKALKIEGRQRGRAYIADVVRACRQAISDFDKGLPVNAAALNDITEGGKQTTGAYNRSWR
ncbi:ubiquinone biosynthesis protein UbiU [Azospirillaceae bacterium]